jgi:predicted dehydrogenase
MKKTKHKAVIIGAGKIASGFDTPRSKHVLTHAHALTSHPGVELVGISDIDSVRGRTEAKKWDTTYWSDTDAMLSGTNPDIIVIATPNHTHKAYLLAALKVRPKVIILEKPAVNEKNEIAVVRRAQKKAGVPVVVNFRRRFDLSVAEFRDGLIKGKYGSILSASALYSKGVLHNGSHMIDLTRHLFGEMLSAKAHFSVDDFPKGEPTIGGVATFERCPQFYLMAGDERSFYVFELTIITEKCRIRFLNEGRDLSVEMVMQDTLYPEDKVLGPAKLKKTKLADSMVRMVEHVVRVADGKEPSYSSLEDALRTQEACNKFL